MTNLTTTPWLANPRAAQWKLSIRWRKTTASWVVYQGREVLESGFHGDEDALEWLLRFHPKRARDFPAAVIEHAPERLKRWHAELLAAAG